MVGSIAPLADDKFAALVEAGAGDGDAGKPGQLDFQVGGGPETEAFESRHIEAFNLVQQAVVKFRGGGLEALGEMSEVFDPLFTGLHLAGNGGFKAEGMAVNRAVGMAFGLAAHVVRGLEGDRLRDLENLALCVQGRPVSLCVCK